jgi:hypothetical protein
MHFVAMLGFTISGQEIIYNVPMADYGELARLSPKDRSIMPAQDGGG